MPSDAVIKLSSPHMTTLIRTVLTTLAALVLAVTAWVALKWGLGHYSFKTPFVASCHVKHPDPTKCLADSAQAVLWHNLAPTVLRFLLVAAAGGLLARSILRLRDGLFGYRW
jgi:hypothetical protein